MQKRNLYLSNTPVEDALEQFQSALAPHIKQASETIAVIQSLDRVTSEAIYAKCNSPLYNSAAMDGIAVIAAKTHGASEATPLTLSADECIAVDTGDPIRQPYDAVIMAEDIQMEETTATIRAAAATWQHIRPVGEDIVQGEMILPRGHTIRPMDIGVLLSGGIAEIPVCIRPKVAVIPTGTELTELDSEAETSKSDGGIIESNSRMFEALVQKGGGIPTRFSPVPDIYEKLIQTLKDAINDYDMVLFIAGTSAGRDDYTVHVLKALGEVIVHGVAMKPGKPVILAVVNGKPVIGVPGYPVSAYIAYENFAAPILKSLSGVSQNEMPIVQATLSRRLVSSLKHREYVRVRVGKVGERLIASPLARGAGAAMSLVRADGFCVVDQDDEGIEAGATVNILLSRTLHDLEKTVVSIGSHDLILDIVADMMHKESRLSSTHVGSMGGLLALKNGEAHMAPFHLLDEETGEYNIPFIKKLFPNRQMAIIKGVGRVQCIMTQQGNPLSIKSIDDLTKGSFINRQRGAGTRLLLDYQLKLKNINPSKISGYEKEAATHMAVAAAVQSGNVDAGIGIQSAAKAMGLDYIPIGEEAYDFAMPVEFLELPHVKSFIKVLQCDAFKLKLTELGGYTSINCGAVNMI